MYAEYDKSENTQIKKSAEQSVMKNRKGGNIEIKNLHDEPMSYVSILKGSTNYYVSSSIGDKIISTNKDCNFWMN